MHRLRYFLLMLLVAAIVLPTSGCWQVLALQGAMAAAQIAGAETEDDPTKDYCDEQDEYIKEYFKKDRYDQAPNDPAMARVPRPAAKDIAGGPEQPDPLMETAAVPQPAPSSEQTAVAKKSSRDATSLADEFKTAP